MRTYTTTVTEGENMGPVDWTHETARGKPPIWREAEASPQDFLFDGRMIVEICMYDGWPYWRPMPAIRFIGPLNISEWTFFNSYGVYDYSIARREEPAS